MIGIEAADRKPSRIAPHGRIGLEPHPRGDPQPDRRPGAGSTRAQPAGTGGALHGRGKILCLGGVGLSASRSARSYHQSGRIVIKAAEEFRDDTTARQPALADRLHLSQDHGMGLVLPLHRAGRDLRASLSPGSSVTTMKAQDVMATLDLALAASGLDQDHRRVHLIRGSCRITARHMSRAVDLADRLSTSRTSSMSAERPSIRRPRAKSSAGIRRSRTASCLSTLL